MGTLFILRIEIVIEINFGYALYPHEGISTRACLK